MFKLVLEKAEEPEIKLPTFCWIMEKAREFQKNIYFHFTDCAKDFMWITTNWKILKGMEIPDHLTCILRNLYVGQETTVRALYGATDWFKTEKGVRQSCLLSPVCLIYTLNTS